jgi:hypothetical protein
MTVSAHAHSRTALPGIAIWAVTLLGILSAGATDLPAQPAVFNDFGLSRDFCERDSQSYQSTRETARAGWVAMT